MPENNRSHPSRRRALAGALVGVAMLTKDAIAGPLPDIPKGSIAVELKTIAGGLAGPNQLVDPGDGSGRLFVVEQPGVIRVIQNGIVQSTPLLDIQSLTLLQDRTGMRGMAVHPGFADPLSSGYRTVYTVFNQSAGTAAADLSYPGAIPVHHQSVLTEWKIDSSNPNRIDLASRRDILRINEPGFGEHDMALPVFGPDAMLYVAVGDGIGGGDPLNLAQNPSTVHGSILRIDVNATDGRNGRYGIPNDNPFADGVAGLPEVFAYGFRNPWRISFDSVGGDLYAGEVGRANIEEINRVESGQNYGWPLKEGTFKHIASNSTISTDLTGLPAGLIDPIAQYDHDDGVAIMGGFVYRGSAIPELYGKYVFGDYGKPDNPPGPAHPARLFYLDLGSNEIFELMIGLDDRGFATLGGRHPLGFGQDSAGELYVLTDLGEAIRIVAIPEPAAMSMIVLGGLAAGGRRRKARREDR